MPAIAEEPYAGGSSAAGPPSAGPSPKPFPPRGIPGPPPSAPVTPSRTVTLEATRLQGRRGQAKDFVEPFSSYWPTEAVQFSKWLSFLLCRDPFPVRPDGYAEIAKVLSHPGCPPSASMQLLLQVIASSDKFGLFLDTNGQPKWVRALQGHSTDKGVKPILLMDLIQRRDLPELVGHGTQLEAVSSIMIRGLLPGGLRRDRQCLQFSPYEGHRKMRTESAALVVVDTAKALDHGVRFYLAESGAILTPHVVPRDCFQIVMNLSSGAILFDGTGLASTQDQEPAGPDAEPPAQPQPPQRTGDSSSDTSDHEELLEDIQPPATIACVGCRDLLPLGTLLCHNCISNPLTLAGEARVEGKEDVDRYCNSTVKLADRFGVPATAAQVKKPRPRGIRNPNTVAAKRARKKQAKDLRRKAAELLSQHQQQGWTSEWWRTPWAPAEGGWTSERWTSSAPSEGWL